MPRPHPAQKRILRGARRFNAVACGRRFGKTTLGIHRLLEPALAGYPVGWFAPKYKYLMEAWREFKRVLKPVTKKKDETEKRIELIGGGVLEFWSLQDEDAGRSRKYKRVVIDEAGLCKNLEAAWNGAIRPTLTDLKGDADLYGTPKGRNFFWTAFAWGQDPLEPDWAAWRFPTTSNPYIDAAEVESARRKMPERLFLQEYSAEFLEDAGGVFRNVSASVDRGRTANLTAAEPGRTYSQGVDLARVEDFTVNTILDNGMKQVYFDRFNQISWERQISSILVPNASLRPVAYVDSTGLGDPIFERVINAGVHAYPYQLNNASKSALIDNLAMQLEQGKIRLMDHPEQEAELQAYAYELTPSRNVRMGAPEGMHDDTVIALALATWGASGCGTYSAGAY